jgi:hypothetical protein
MSEKSTRAWTLALTWRLRPPRPVRALERMEPGCLGLSPRM